MNIGLPVPGFDAAGIREAERSIVALLEDPDVNAGVSAYTEDAIFCLSGAKVIHGRQEMLNRPKNRLFSVSLEPLATEGNGNLAHVYGRISCFVGRTEISEGTPVNVRFLIVWRKESDGVWRIAKEFLNAAE